jgi:hypothetical protein
MRRECPGSLTLTPHRVGWDLAVRPTVWMCRGGKH